MVSFLRGSLNVRIQRFSLVITLSFAMNNKYLLLTEQKPIFDVVRVQPRCEIAVFVKRRDGDGRARTFPVLLPPPHDERSNYFQTFLINCPYSRREAGGGGGTNRFFCRVVPTGYLNCVEYFRSRGGDAVRSVIPVKKHLAYQFHGTTRCIAGNPAWWIVFLFLAA